MNIEIHLCVQYWNFGIFNKVPPYYLISSDNGHSNQISRSRSNRFRHPKIASDNPLPSHHTYLSLYVQFRNENREKIVANHSDPFLVQVVGNDHGPYYNKIAFEPKINGGSPLIVVWKKVRNCGFQGCSICVYMRNLDIFRSSK